MPKRSSQEPALGASVVSSAKRTEESPSKHNQATTGAKRQSCSSMPKVGCDDYNFNSSSQRMDGWNKSVIWAQKDDHNTKGEAAGWPRWEAVNNQSREQYSRPVDAYEDDSTIACKRGWNVPEDGNAKRVTGEGGDAIHHDGLDKWRQSSPNIHMVDKGSLSKSACWDRPADGNGKQETGEWPGAMSKTVRQYNSHQNRKGCRNQSLGWATSEDGSTMACKRGWNESGDGREKRENGDHAFDHDGDGWKKSRFNIHTVDKGSLRKSASWDRNVKRENNGGPRWSGAMPKTTRQCSSHQNRKGYWNQSERWNLSEDGSTMGCKRERNESGDGREERENGGDAFDQDSLDGWKQSGSNIHSMDKGCLSKSHSMDKGCLSKSASWDRVKDENEKRENDGWRRWPEAMSKITQQCTSYQNMRSLSKSASWDRVKDENVKRENDGGRRWPEAMSNTTRQCTSHQNSQSKGWTTSEDDFNMACTRGWNESGDGKEKKETADGSDAFNHDGCDGWKPSSSNIYRVDKGSLSKSAYWDHAKDENAKRDNDGCDDYDGWKPSCSNIFRVDKGSLSKSATWDHAKDENAKRENDGWPRWPGAMPKTIGQFPSHQNRNVSWQSRGWTASDDGDSQKGTSGRNPNLVQSGDPWMQRGSVTSPKCDWSKTVTWNASKGDSLDRDQRKWNPGLNQTGGDPWKQITPTVPPKAGRRKIGSGTVAQGEISIRRKSKWSGAPDFSDPDASKQHGLRWSASMPSTSEQCPSSHNRKDGRNQSWGRISSEYGDSLKDTNGKIADLDRSDDPQLGPPDFGDPNAPKQNMHTFLPKFSGKRLFRGRGRTPYHASEHEHYQSNDTYNTYKKESDGVSSYYGDSPSGRSRSGFLVRHQINDAVEKHPGRDADEFWDSKRHDKRTSFEDPWKQRNHLQDTKSSRHWSCDDGAGKDKLFPNDTSYDRFPREKCSYHDSFSDRACPVKDRCKEICHDRRDSDPRFGSCVDLRELDVKVSEWFHSSRQFMSHGVLQNKSSDDKFDQKNAGNVSSWNVPKVSSKTIVKDSLGQSHLMRDYEVLRDNNTIKSNVTTPNQNVYQNVTNSPRVWKNQQKRRACQQSTQNFGSHMDDQTDHTTTSPIQFGQNMQVNSRLPFRTKSSNPNGQCQQSPSNPKDEVQNHEQQAMLNIRDSSTTQAITASVRSSDPVFVQAPINPQELKTSSKTLEQVPISVGICEFSEQFIKTMNCPYSRSWNTSQSEPVDVQAKGESCSSSHEQQVGPNGELNGRIDDKGIRMFKFALAEFVKETIKPVWNEGRLSKEAYKTVVKKVVDKVVGVLGTNIPQTQERIDQYLAYAKDKLHKLVQDYLEIFINT